jgi:hypothetical protein
MHHRSYRLLPVLAAFPLAILSVSPAPVSAQSAFTERCAVGVRYEPGYGPATVIRVYGSVNTQATVQTDAAVCSDMIAQGWFPESNHGEWERRNGGAYRPVCAYTWPWGDSVNVFTLPGNEYYGWTDCNNFSGGSGPSDLTGLF